MSQETSAPAPQAQWWSLNRPEGGGTHMKAVLENGRWVITDVYVHGHGLTMADLAEVPLRQLERITNLADPSYASGRPGDPTLAELRLLAAAAPSELPTTQDSGRERLTRPDGTDPDGFYARVAEAYREYATRMSAPAVQISVEADVPLATARTWVREARRRGKLPEGRKGRAG